jgi:hypothetical protein
VIILSTYDALHKFSQEASQIVRYVYFRSLPRAEQDLNPMKSKLSALGEVGRGFYDAIHGIHTAAKERDFSSFFMKLYRHGDPKAIMALSDKFKQEAYRSTTDDYERGFLIAWEIAAKMLAELKESYPEYPLKDEPQAAVQRTEAEEQSYFTVQPRKKTKATSGKQG